MNHRATLGLPNTADADQIKTAWRKLAMQLHPDREGGDTAKFQAVQTAYMELEKSGFAPFVAPRQAPPQPPPRGSWGKPEAPWGKPESPSGTWRDRNETIDDILDQMRTTGRGQNPHRRNPGYVQPGSDVVARVSMREAFAGFNMQVSRQRSNGMIEHVYVNIPPGTPDGYRGKYKLSDGSHETITTTIETGDFKLRGMSSHGSLFDAGLDIGDIEIELEVDALDLITGGWVKVKDFLGEELTIRIPAGFNPLQRLKVAGKGYKGWDATSQSPSNWRQHMFVRLRPIFNKPSDIDKNKIKNLYDSVGGWENESKPDPV